MRLERRRTVRLENTCLPRFRRYVALPLISYIRPRPLFRIGVVRSCPPNVELLLPKPLEDFHIPNVEYQQGLLSASKPEP